MVENKSDNNFYNKKYFIQPDAGLGNRLYCMYSAFYYMKHCGRKFDIIWLRENCCNVPFERLFDKQSFPTGTEIVTTWHLGYRNRYALPTVLSNIYMIFIKKINRYYTAEATRDVFNGEGREGILNIMGLHKKLCIKANGKYFDTACFDEVRDCITPSKEIREMVADIMKLEDRKEAGNIQNRVGKDNSAESSEGPVYGIHIRRTDNRNSIKYSPIEAFDELMEGLSKENPGCRFYLATDDEEVERSFAQKYNVIKHKTFGSSKSRDSVTGIMDAYVDMLCLAECSKIYGSFGSSFSEMAALIGNKPFEVVVKD